MGVQTRLQKLLDDAGTTVHHEFVLNNEDSDALVAEMGEPSTPMNDGGLYYFKRCIVICNGTNGPSYVHTYLTEGK